MSKREPPSQEAFDKLLAWLDADRAKAAEKHQRIYFRLVRIFAAKGCFDAEDLADETFNVVTSKIDELRETYRGDPALYFYGVAKRIYQEWLKKKRPPPPPIDPDKTEIEYRCGCLEKCLQQLPNSAEAQLAVRYHEGEGQARIENRKKIAQEFGITLNALRIRICHLQARLRPCIEKCLKRRDG
jgi:DNA-directed RNA polymerase specialized sigma24 family protein